MIIIIILLPFIILVNIITRRTPTRRRTAGRRRPVLTGNWCPNVDTTRGRKRVKPKLNGIMGINPAVYQHLGFL